MRKNLIVAGITALLGCLAAPLHGQATKSEYPPLEQITKGYEKVVSTTDGQKPFYSVWIDKKRGQMLCELPRTFATQKHFFALTISSGDSFAGLQEGDLYLKWRQYDKKLALIQPNVEIRSTGDTESKDSVKRLFTDRVLLDVPILTMVPRGGPVIDMDALLVGQASKFFGSSVRVSRSYLSKIVKAKAFPKNIEVAFEVPNSTGKLQTLHYSISLVPENTGYKPRAADERVGYFTTSYTDYGKYDSDETRTRYINRWYLKKRQPSLKISPPEKPIVFYLEHTTPVRYRRWVQAGVEYWNTAFEKVGISKAIVVNTQDKMTGDFMDLDPEDVRYNFIRWLNNGIGTAIGPSRVHPETGQILDADIVLTDGWIRHFQMQFEDIMPKIAMEGMSPETLAWLAKHPKWDPRVRLAPPASRDFIQRSISRQALQPLSGHAMANQTSNLIGDDPFDGLVNRTSQVNGLCMAAQGKSFDLTMMRMALNMMVLEDEKKKDSKDKDKKDEPKEPMLDGIPESFIGPLLADLVAHEVGHTLGLRHNFRASSLFTLAEMNDEKLKGKKAFSASVMDYIPINFNMKAGKVQGDYGMIGIGPYDYWAIEYGYTFESDLSKILARTGEAELAYATDEDTFGPDPFARRYDFSKDPLDFAKNQVRLAKHHRAKILDNYVKKGDSWAKAREGYQMTLSFQTRAVSMMSNWIGGSFVFRFKKGDAKDKAPLQVVPVEQQRKALDFVMENTFKDEAFGLNPKLLSFMTRESWLDGDGFMNAMTNEATWPVHDRIMGVQASTLTQLMNPTTLRRVYDNEFRTPEDEEALTLPELLEKISKSIWSEFDKAADKKYTSRKPMVSSLRRNLQREHLDRLLDLVLDQGTANAATKTIANLAMMELRGLLKKINKALKVGGENLDPYTKGHLHEAELLIKKSLEAQVIYNQAGGGSPGGLFLFGNQPQNSERR